MDRAIRKRNSTSGLCGGFKLFSQTDVLNCSHQRFWQITTVEFSSQKILANPVYEKHSEKDSLWEEIVA